MPFYIRKSVSAGPFRLNFSKSGIGMSVGIKGFRLGTGPRGHYVHAGRGGLYYRSSLGRAGQKPRPYRQGQTDFSAYREAQIDHITMVDIESSDVMQMTDSTVSEVLSDINSKATQPKISKICGWIGGLLGGVFLFVDAGLALATWSLTFVAWLSGKWVDSYNRRTVLFYDLESDAESAYKEIIQAFDSLNECAGKWHRSSIGQINTLTMQKRHGGANHLVSKKETSLNYKLPSVIACNITPPSINAGIQTLYFFPDMILVSQGNKFGAVNYNNIITSIDRSHFIERDRVPSDAKIIQYTWQHPNKDGSPDRRFASNRRLPICLYETIHLSSSSGLNEMFEFSRVGAAQAFKQAIANMGKASTGSPTVHYGRI